MDVIVTTDDARALVALVDRIEAHFILGKDARLEHRAFAPTGEPYVELTSTEWLPDRNAVCKAALAAFEAYARSKPGSAKLYWRVRPEIGQEHGKGWKFYMRLLISSKETK